MNYGDGSMVLYFLKYYQGSAQANGGIHEEGSTGVGSDGTFKMILLYLIYTHGLSG